MLDEQKRLEELMKSRLQTAGLDQDFELIDKSHHHKGHAGVTSADGKKIAFHYELRIVSPRFIGQSTVERQRYVYQLFKDLMPLPLHSLTLKTLSPCDPRTKG